MPSLRGRALTVADTLLDRSVLAGYSRVGYRLRRRAWREPSPSLVGRAVIVTGASSGIGEAICLLLARRGADVHMVVRSRERGERARRRLAAVLAGAPGVGGLELEVCDVSDLEQVDEVVGRLGDDRRELAGLVHNAGVLGDRRQLSAQGHELTFATTVLGPFALTAGLLPALRRGSMSAVVFVSSGGMLTSKLDAADPELSRRDFDGPRFYAHAKRAQVVLAELLAERCDGVAFASMHPGWVDTPGLAASLPGFHRLMRPILRTPAEGADTAAWLLGGVHAFEHPGAFWHDRRPRPKHLLPGTRESAAERESLWRALIQDSRARAFDLA